MVTLPTSGGSEATEEYQRLRQLYDAAFRELSAQTRRRQDLVADVDPDCPANLQSSAGAVRDHRDRIADFLLRTPDSAHRTHSQVQEAAYYLWLNAGCPIGTSISDWLAAQRQIAAQR